MKALFISLLTIAGLLPLSVAEKNSPFVLIASVTNQSAPKTPYAKQREIEVIDNELESLLNLHDYYTNKMKRYKARALRLELQGEHLDESKHLSMEADKFQSVINQIEDEIARLEKERSAILKS